MKRTKIRGLFIIKDENILTNIIKNHEQYSTKHTICEIKCEKCGKNFRRNLRHILEKKYYKECAFCSANHIKEEKYGPSKLTQQGLKNIQIAQHNNKIERCNKCKQTKLLRYGNENYNNFQKAKTTKKELYGNENYHNIEKMKETNKLKYGKEYYSQTENYIDKIKNTCQNRYNSDFYFQSIDYKEKTHNTCKEKYGVDYYTQSKDYKEKTTKTCLDKYGVPYPLSHFSKCRSNFEDKIIEFIKELSINYTTNNRTILNGKEIDILFEDKKKCIEVQGSFWHCDPRFYDENFYHKVKNKTAKEIWEYDYNKKILIESKQLQILYIWEYDWETNIEGEKLKIKEFLND